MTAPPFPDRDFLALLTTAEATADRIESAVVFQINSLVGSGGEFPALTMSIDCERIDFGDSTVGRIFQNIVQGLCDFLKGLLDSFVALLSFVAGQIFAFVQDLLASLAFAIDELISRVTSALDTAITAIFNTVERIFDTILTKLGDVIDVITDTAFDVVTAIGNSIRDAISAVGAAVDFIVGKIGDGFNALLGAATSVVESIRDTVGSIIQAIIDTASEVFLSISRALSTLIETLTGAAETGLGAVRETIENIPKALRELAEDVGGILGDVVGAPLGLIGKTFITQVEEFFAALVDDMSLSPDKVIRDFLTTLGVPANTVERIAQSATTAMPVTPLPFVVALAFLVPLMLLPAVAVAMGPVMEQLRQEVNQAVRPTLLSPGDAIASFVRGTSTDADLREELSQAGFSDQRIDLLVSNSRRLLDLGELFRWWLRGIITEDQLDELISFHRISDADAARLKQAVFFIPPVNDLITMAVREVFSPTVRDEFKLDEDFPEDFEAFAHKQGISVEWAKNYWAAHWVLPSINHGFQMLHRRIITAEQLDTLMRAQDVMPFWRENLKLIAFSPLTRVDVRRMHGLGLIGEDELVSRYMDLGFDEPNAEMMRAFTAAFNADDPSEVLELEGLTRSTILGMFDDGILSEQEAKDIMMTGLGLSENVTELFLSHRKLVRERNDRRALISSVVELAGGGIIQLPEAQDSLARAGLTAVEIAMAVRRILAKRETRDRLPTVTQLAKMLAAEIIAVDVWRDAMAGHGYPDVWIDRIGALQATGEVAEEADSS